MLDYADSLQVYGSDRYELHLFVVGWRGPGKERPVVPSERFDHIAPLLPSSAMKVFDYRPDEELLPVTFFEVSTQAPSVLDPWQIEKAVARLAQEGDFVIGMFDGLYMGSTDLLRPDSARYIYAVAGPLGTAVAMSRKELESDQWADRVSELQCAVLRSFV